MQSMQDQVNKTTVPLQQPATFMPERLKDCDCFANTALKPTEYVSLRLIRARDFHPALVKIQTQIHSILSC